MLNKSGQLLPLCSSPLSVSIAIENQFITIRDSITGWYTADEVLVPVARGLPKLPHRIHFSILAVGIERSVNQYTMDQISSVLPELEQNTLHI